MKKRLQFSPEKLLRIMEQSGLGRTEIARRSELTESGIWKIEKGNNKPRTETLLQLAAGLGVKITDFFVEAA